MDTTEIKKALTYLLDQGQIAEVRIFDAVQRNGYSKALSGYFDNVEKLISEVSRVERENEKIEGFYFTPNPVVNQLLARAENKILAVKRGMATSDANIVKYNYFLIDIDAVCPKGTSSSNLQHEKAIVLALKIKDWLKLQGWADPVVADSGNGAHLMYRVNMDVSEKETMKNALKTISMNFVNDDVKVDLAVFNPSRIWKMYGTMARKGSDTADYPHRLARILWDKSPEKLEQTDKSKIQKLATPTVYVALEKDTLQDGRFKIENWLEKNKGQLNLRSLKSDKDEKREMWSFEICPFFNDHVGSTYIYKYKDGGLGFKCFGERCVDNHWEQFREKIEPGYKAKRKENTSPVIGEFFFEPKLDVFVYVDIENENFHIYSSEGKWKNKFELLNSGKKMPKPYNEVTSVYDPKRSFGYFLNDNIKTFNRFKPSEYWFKEYASSYVTKPTPIFDALYDNVFFGDNTVNKLLAKMLQDHERFPIVPVIINEEGGAGKAKFENFVVKFLLGENNCSLNLGQEDLESKYNDYLVDKLYIGFHETEDTAENAGIASRQLRKIKRLYDPTITIEQKYIRRVPNVPNHAACIIYSNNANPVSINKHDRRVYVIRSRETQLQKISFFKQTKEDTKANIDTLKEKIEVKLKNELFDVVCNLKRMNIEADFGKVPGKTLAKSDLQDRSNGPIQNFIEALIKGDVDTLKAITAEKRGYFDDDAFINLVVKTKGKIRANDVRTYVGQVGNGRWAYETVRKLMPMREKSKAGGGYDVWQIEYQHLKSRGPLAANTFNFKDIH